MRWVRAGSSFINRAPDCGIYVCMYVCINVIVPRARVPQSPKHQNFVPHKVAPPIYSIGPGNGTTSAAKAIIQGSIWDSFRII
jgi:hypothetical protein